MQIPFIEGAGAPIRLLARAGLVIAVLTGLCRAQTQVVKHAFTERSNPAGLIQPLTVKVQAGTERRVGEFAEVSGNSRFGFWTFNSVRQSYPNGQAYMRPSVTVNAPIDAVANFFPVHEDGDGDRLQDWWEYWMFGNRDRGPQDDDDGDGLTHEDEFRSGCSARFVDDVKAGGVAARLSAPLRMIIRNRLRYTLRSEPLGLVSGDGELAPGESYTTPYLLGDTSGYTFVGFEINGQVQRGTTGHSLNRITITPSADTVIIARYVVAGIDTDADGIPDALEWQNFGTLANGPTSDPDGDGIPIAEERRLGLGLVTADRIRDGGVASRLSAPLEYDRIRSRYLVQSRPLGLISSTSELIANGTERTSPHLGTDPVAGYMFGYWSLNGQRLTDGSGVARRQVKVTVQGTSELVAHFFPPDQDTDTDGLPDWWEWNLLGNLDRTTANDPDGDGYSIAVERSRGFAVTKRDEPRDGGIASRLSAPLQYESGSRKRLAIRSAPRGIVVDSQSYLALNTAVTSSHYPFSELYSGYQFTHWTRNGVRVKDATGFSRNQAVFALQEDTDLVAHFVLPGEDRDADTLPDFLEYRLADDLTVLQPNSDPDGDGFTLAAERSQGLSVLAADAIRDGGIASRLSAPASLQFSVPPLELRPASLVAYNGSPSGTLVAALSLSPTLAGRSYQFALEMGPGGEDNANFQVVNNQLRLAATMNVTTRFLNIRLRATDDQGAVRTWQSTVEVQSQNPNAGPLAGEWITEGSGNWSGAANWLDQLIPDGAGSAAAFRRNRPALVALDSARTVGSMAFANADHRISGIATLTLWANSAAPTITVGSGATAELAAPVGGNQGLSLAGPGSLLLSGAWNYTGPTTVSNGTLGSKLQSGTSATLGNLNLNGGRLVALNSGATNLGNFQLRGDVSATGSARSEIAADVRIINGETRDFRVEETGDSSDIDLLVSGKIGHHNGSTWGFASKSGAGTMKLSGPNELGSLTVNQGRVILEDAAIGGLFNGGLVTNAQVEFLVTGGNDISFAQVIRGNGSLIKSGNGVLKLQAPSSYSAGTTIHSGTVSISGRSADNGGFTSIGTGPVTLHRGATLISANDWSTGNEWNSGNIGKLTIHAGGTWTISHVGNTLRNGLEINGGTINGLGANNDWGGLYLRSTSITAAANEVSTIAVDTVLNTTTPMDVGASGTLIYSGPIRNRVSAIGALTKSGSGTLILGAVNTYTGATSITAGTLCVNGSITSATNAASGAVLAGMGTIHGAISIANGGTLAPGSPTQAIGTLTAGSSVDLDGTLTIQLSGATADRLNVVGNLDLTQAKLTFTGATTARESIIATYGTLTGANFASVTSLPPGYRVEIDTAKKQVLLVGEASFVSWMSVQALPQTHATPDMDPDGDGISNLLEYVLGGDPSRPDPNIAPRIAVGNGNLTLTFQRPDAAETADVSLSVETSSDLVTWQQSYVITPGPPAPQVSIQENGTNPDTITVTIPASSNQRFTRLKASLNP